MSSKGSTKQSVKQVAAQDKKGTDLDLVQIEALRFANSNLKQQITTLKNQIGDKNIAQCEWKRKYIQDNFQDQAKAISMTPQAKSSSTDNRAKETSLIAEQTLTNLRQQLQQLKTKSSEKSIKDEEKIKNLEESETSLRKQITELTLKNSALNTMIEVYKQNEALIMKFKQAKEQASARRENFGKEITDSIDSQSKVMQDQMRILKDLKKKTEDKEKKMAQDSKKYAKLLEVKQNELVKKQAERVNLQKEAADNANIINSLNNSFINVLSDLTAFEKNIEMVEPQKSEFQKVVNWVGKCKRQKKLSAEWEKVGKNLVSILLNSLRIQNQKAKMQGENEKNVLNDRIQQLENANLIYQQDIKQLNGKISTAGKENEKLIACNKDINSKLTQKTFQLQTANKQINKLKTDKANLEKLLLSSTDQTTRLEKANKELSATFEKHKITKQQQLAKSRKTIEELTSTKQKLESNIKVQKEQNVKRQGQISQLAKQKNTLQIKVKDLQAEVAKLTREKETLQQEKGQLQAERKVLKEKISSLQTSLDRTNNNNSELNRAKIQLSNEGQQLKKKVQEALRNSADIKLKLKYQSQAYASLKKEAEEKQFKFSQFSSSLSLEILHQNNNIQFDPIQLPKFAKELTTVYRQAKFFNGSEIIAPESVNFIIDALWDLTKCRCKSSKLVYRLDPQNTTNFHSYIDKKENLLVVVKLSNGSIVGGFTNTNLESGVSSSQGKGICFNLNHNRIFKPRAGTTQNVTTYDSFYFILGNAEIRLRTGEKKIFSNFGIARSYFDNLDFPRTDFLGVAKSQNNELDIDSYEFFTMQFEQQ